MASINRKSSHEVVRRLRTADEEMPEFLPHDELAFYSYIFELTRDVETLDAFYFCHIVDDGRQLLYSFHFDDGAFEGPDLVPVGQGPSSWVATCGRPYVFCPDNAVIQRSGISFGSGRPSNSIIHVPIREVFGTDRRVLGVVSAQSYDFAAYDEWSVEVLQSIASIAAKRIQYIRDTDALLEALDELGGQADQLRVGASSLGNSVLKELSGIVREIRDLTEDTHLTDSGLAERLSSLSARCSAIVQDTMSSLVSLRSLLSVETEATRFSGEIKRVRSELQSIGMVEGGVLRAFVVHIDTLIGSLNVAGQTGFQGMSGEEHLVSLQQRSSGKVSIGVGKAIMRDINIAGQAGVVGANAHVENMLVQGGGSDAPITVDFGELVRELSVLLEAARAQASTSDQFGEVHALAVAKDAAEAHDGTAATSALSRVGKWTLQIAEKIGVAVAAKVISHTAGLD